jgi:hypothetical protein
MAADRVLGWMVVLGPRDAAQVRSSCYWPPSSRWTMPGLLTEIATNGWSGPWGASKMARARSRPARAASSSPSFYWGLPRFVRVTATLGWSGP